MTALVDLSLLEIREGLRRRDFSAEELSRAYLDRIALTRDLNAYVTVTADHAIARARDADRRLRRGEARALEGIPLAVKDNFCTAGIRTTAGSRILENFTPPYESTVTARLWEAGAILLGKTNMDEFAMGSTSGTSHFGPVTNPLRRSADGAALVPGGSSGGAAAAVGALTCAAAIGSDTGGSIRQPASMCGLVGIKPTYGRCSRWGMIAYASSLDQAGVIGRNVSDAAAVLDVICGHDPKDSTSPLQPPTGFEIDLEGDMRGLRIGIPEEYRAAGMPADMTQLWEDGAKRLEAAGASVIPVNLPHTRYALAAYYIIAMAEASSNLARYDGVRFGMRVEGRTLDEMYRKTRAAGFGTEVKRRILIGTYTLSAGYYDAYYAKAQKVRTLIRRDFDEAFQSVDALLAPTSPIAAFPHGEHVTDPVSLWLIDAFTVPVNLAGLPAISVPGGLSSEGLPLGLQVIGRPWGEETVLRVGCGLAVV